MADINKVIRVGDTLTNIIDSVTKKSVNYRKVTTWYDGSPMTDVKVDGVLYRKKGSEYFRQVIDKDGELFLEKDTMAQMRALSFTERLFLKAGVYKGVQLNGYYSEGDTPAPIQYFLSATSSIDDEGSVIGVNDIKLEHIFTGRVDILYFGAKQDGVTDSSNQIQKASNYCKTYDKRLYGAGTYFINQEVIFACNMDLEDAVLLTDISEGNVVSIGKHAVGTPVLEKKVMKMPKIRNVNFTNNFSGINSTGLELRGGSRLRVFISEVRGFKFGFNIQSEHNLYSDSVIWNDFKFEGFINNETDMKLEANNTGYINQNTFSNFMASKNSTVDATVDKQLVVYNNTGTARIESNTFINCSFESARVRETVNDIVELHNVDYTTFVGCRYEFNSWNRILLDGGTANRFINGYGLRKERFSFINNPEYIIEGMNWIEYGAIRATYYGRGIDLRDSANLVSYGVVYPHDVVNDGSFKSNHVERVYLENDVYSEKQYYWGRILSGAVKVRRNASNQTVLEFNNFRSVIFTDGTDLVMGNTFVIKNEAYVQSSLPTGKPNGWRAYNTSKKRIASTNGTSWFDYDGAPIDVLRRGTTAQRPNLADIPENFVYMDVTLAVAGKPIFKSGPNWVDMNGAIV